MAETSHAMKRNEPTRAPPSLVLCSSLMDDLIRETSAQVKQQNRECISQPRQAWHRQYSCPCGATQASTLRAAARYRTLLPLIPTAWAALFATSTPRPPAADHDMCWNKLCRAGVAPLITPVETL